MRKDKAANAQACRLMQRATGRCAGAEANGSSHLMEQNGLRPSKSLVTG